MSEKKSLMSKYCTPEVEAKYKDTTTSTGFTLAKAVNSGKLNPDSSIGAYAGDAESYHVFADLFYPIIKEYHGGYDAATAVYKPNLNPADLKIDNPDPEGKYVVSTRIRVGRNIENEPLSTNMSKEKRLEIEARVAKALQNFSGDLAGKYYPLDGMNEDDRVQLVKDHFLFKKGDRFLDAAGANTDWPAGRGIFHSADKRFLVWVGEEDQLRIISMQPGADIAQVFERLMRGIKGLEEFVKFGFDPHLGWISSCPTNLGTSMRASVHIKLEKLSKQAHFKELAEKLRLSVRGVHGEHSESEGGVYDISNKERLGITEVDAARILYDGVKQLIAEEQKL